MATAKKSSGGGNFLTKKAGPLPRWGWAAAAAGTYLAYRYLKDREASTASTAASGTTGGTTIPNDIGLPTSTSTTGAGSFASVASWTQAALEFMTSNGLDSADSLNAITSWLNGNCVSQQGYTAISSAISNASIGLPPGFTTLPTLSVCSGSSATAPATGGTNLSGTTPVSTPGSNTDTNFIEVLAGQVIPNGIQLFYEIPGSGVFEPYDGNTALPTGTPLYITPNSTQPTGFQQGNNNPGTQVVPTT